MIICIVLAEYNVLARDLPDFSGSALSTRKVADNELVCWFSVLEGEMRSRENALRAKMNIIHMQPVSCDAIVGMLPGPSQSDAQDNGRAVLHLSIDLPD